MNDKDEKEALEEGVHCGPPEEAETVEATLSRSYLVQPKGPGTGYQLRMRTPATLVGTLDPTSGRPFGTEIRRGLGTRDLRLAGTRAAIVRGELLRLVERLRNGGAPSLTVDRALAWAEAIAEQDARGGPEDHEPDLRDLVQEEASRNRNAPSETRERFLKVAAKGVPLDRILGDYLAARSPGNIGGLKPLATTTTHDLRTALKHLSAHLGRPLSDILLGDVDADTAHRFRASYLRDKLRLGHQTVAKHNTLLLGLWRWAAEERLPGAPEVNPWVAPRLVPRSRHKAPEETRGMFSPEEVEKLLAGLPADDRVGDLFRLLLVTGCRVDEVARLPRSAVGEEGFTIAAGKTLNASRWVPVPVLARGLLTRGDDNRLFPEFPLRPSTGKAASASAAFTRERRDLLGGGSDGRLSLHSTRHTWKTIARRAGLPEDIVNDLGGWAGPRRSSSAYDHGLLRGQLQEAQEKVADRLRVEGYLKGW